jgi:hypothetical protein
MLDDEGGVSLGANITLSDYLTDNAFVEAFLYEKKKLDIFPFFFILKERMFFLSLDKRA